MIPVTSDRVEGDALLGLLRSNDNGVGAVGGDGGNSDVLFGRNDDWKEEGGGGGLEKLRLLAIEASEQCERLSIPTITTDLSLNSRRET